MVEVKVSPAFEVIVSNVVVASVLTVFQVALHFNSRPRGTVTLLDPSHLYVAGEGRIRDPMFIAEIQLVHPELALTHTLSTVPEMSIELDYQIIADPETYYLFFEVSNGDFAAFDAAVEDDPTVADSTVIIESDEFRVYRMRLLAVERLVLPKAAELGMRVLHAEAGGGGWRAKLEVPASATFQQFRSYCSDKDVEFTIIRLYHTDSEDRSGEFGLTPTQRETLVAAYEAGYFNEPRDASLQAVADQLGISQSAASGRLRRAISALVSSTVVAE